MLNKKIRKSPEGEQGTGFFYNAQNVKLHLQAPG